MTILIDSVYSFKFKQFIFSQNIVWRVNREIFFRRCCDLFYINICWFMKIGLCKWNFFCVNWFFFINFDFKNECKNEFRDNNEKSCSWSRNNVSHKIDFKAVCPRNGHAANLGVKEKCHQMVKKISEGQGLNLFLTTSLTTDSIGKSMTRNFHFKNTI